MERTFESLVNGLHRKYEALVNMEPMTVDTVPADAPVGGVYLFTENGRNMYAGRTKRSIR